MDNQLEKFVLWMRGEFILLFREIKGAFKKNEELVTSIDELRAELRKGRTINVTHEVKIPEIKIPDVIVPEIKVPEFKMPDFVIPKMDMPEIKLPPINIPEIKIPPIKIPEIKVPKPEVTVNVVEREDKREIKLLTDIKAMLTEMKSYNLWDQVGRETPLPVILVDENSKYYRAEGSGGGGGIVMSAGGGSGRSLNNIIFGSGSGTVTTAGQPFQLPNIPCSEVTVTANEGNQGIVVVGGSNVVGAKNGRIGQPLEPLNSQTLAIDNLSKVFVDAVTSGDGFTYTYLA